MGPAELAGPMDKRVEDVSSSTADTQRDGHDACNDECLGSYFRDGYRKPGTLFVGKDLKSSE